MRRIHLYDFKNDRQYAVNADSEEGKEVYLQDLIGATSEVIETAFTHPGLSPKRNPTIENAMKAVATEVEKRAMFGVQAAVEPILQDMYDMFTLENGEYSDADAPDEYSSALDDKVEACIEFYEPYLSADWLGRNTIDTRLWEDQAIGKLAQSMGKEVYKQLSYGKTPAQVLSNAGIVKADVEIYFDQHMQQQNTEKEKAVAEANEDTLADIVSRIHAQVGKDFDMMTVYEDLELAMDDDEILANGAAKRLGLEDEDCAVLQMLPLEHEDAPQHVIDLLSAAGDKPVKTKREKAPKADKPAKADAGEKAMNRMLALLKEHGSAKDVDMASTLGVSRATYNNWINGKSPFAPEAEQLALVREQIVINVNGLLEALALADGTEQMKVV